MKIYTKTGDTGTTSLFGGKRVLKSHFRIDAYGTVDELNAYLGLLRDQEVNQHIQETLLEIQNNLFTVGAILATEPGTEKVKVPQLREQDVSFLEMAIDQIDTEMPPLRNFILPGGHPSVSFGHVARTVCRRAERLVIALNEQEKVDPNVIIYLNRLSDYLFMLCRKMTLDLGIIEMPWKKKV